MAKNFYFFLNILVFSLKSYIEKKLKSFLKVFFGKSTNILDCWQLILSKTSVFLKAPGFCKSESSGGYRSQQPKLKPLQNFYFMCQRYLTYVNYLGDLLGHSSMYYVHLTALLEPIKHQSYYLSQLDGRNQCKTQYFQSIKVSYKVS